MIRKLLLAILLFAAFPALAVDYGRTTVGALRTQAVEVTVVSRLITIPGGEPAVAIYAYLQTTNASTANCKGALYRTSDSVLVYETSQLSFTDDTGGWHALPFTSVTPAAGTYQVSVGCGPISGGLNTVYLATDTVVANTDYRVGTNVLGGSQSTYPAFPNPITWDGPSATPDGSIYLQTTAGGGPPIPVKFYHYIQGKKR